MAVSNAENIADFDLPSRHSELKRVASVFLSRKIAIFGLIVIVLAILVAVFAPLIAPYDPYAPDFANHLQDPSWKHLLGTDSLGRDTLSRILFGTRTSLIVGVLAVGLGSVVGGTMGLIAAFFGGRVYAAIMRIIDAVMTIPPILIALMIASVLGGGIGNLVIALSIGSVPIHARLMCGQALSIKQNDYILSCRAKGASNFHIMVHHIIPNAFPPLLVAITIDLGVVILAEAGLSFLGVGVIPPTAAWGSMVNEGYKQLFNHPLLSIAPGAAIMLIVFSFNMAGDGLRDALDPRLRGTF